MKKLLSGAILCAMLLAAAGCGSESTAVDSSSADTAPSSSADTAVQETAELTEEQKYPLPEVDMDGFTLTFYNYDDSWLNWAVSALDAEAENGDNINDAIFRRNRTVEDRYNCNIEETLVPSVHDGYKQLIMSGENAFDISMMMDEVLARYYVDGLLRSWDVLKNVDLERSWWDQNANDVFQIKGKQFAAVGDFSLSMVSRGFVILFNKEMIAGARLDDNLYDLVRSGQWTLDKYSEIGKQFIADLNGDGTMNKDDQYATSGAVKLHFGALAIGAGVQYIDVDQEGVPYFAVAQNPRSIEVFEKIFDMHNGTDFYYQVVKGDIHGGSAEARPIFTSGRTVFNGSAIFGISLYRDIDFDIGIIPYPKYDTDQKEYRTLTSGAGVATIPATLPDDRMENVGILLEAMSRTSQKDLLPTYKEVVLKTKYARDADSADMLDLIFKSTTYDMGLSIYAADTYWQYMQSFSNMKNNFSSLTEKIEPKVTKQLEKMMDALESNE